LHLPDGECSESGQIEHWGKHGLYNTYDYDRVLFGNCFKGPRDIT
jgi:hypothetical protein